ncbi:MAG: hypothetical protein VW879_04320, partial [Opitutae bacterium]
IPQPKPVVTERATTLKDEKQLGGFKPSDDARQPFNDPSLITRSELETVIKNMMAGQDDGMFEKSVNAYIAASSQQNTAEQRRLALQIQNDPNLRDQPAGIAMLQAMGREQGLATEQMLGALTTQNLDRIMDLQKFGVGKAFQAIDARNNDKLEAIDLAMNNGDYAAAATGLEEFIRSAFPGLPVTVNTEELMRRDPTVAEDLQSKMNLMRDLADVNPEAATAIARTLLEDPIIARGIPEGMTAEDMVAAIQDGSLLEDTRERAELNTELNTMAASDAPYEQARGLLPEVFGTPEGAIQYGKRLSLDEINEAVDALGFEAGFSQDEYGQIIDSKGNLLDDEDFKELAYQKTYYDRIQETNTQGDVDRLFDWAKQNSPKFARLLEVGGQEGEDSIRTGMAALVATNAFQGFDKDGKPVFDQEQLNFLEPSKRTEHLFYNWPTGVFDEETNTWTDFDATREVFDRSDAHPWTVLADEALDKAFQRYWDNGAPAGELDMREWYFASKGGILDYGEVDTSLIPEGITPETGSPAETTSETREQILGDLTQYANDQIARISNGEFLKRPEFSDDMRAMGTSLAGLGLGDSKAEVKLARVALGVSDTKLTSGELALLILAVAYGDTRSKERSYNLAKTYFKDDSLDKEIEKVTGDSVKKWLEG